jgi:hypothetical protein
MLVIPSCLVTEFAQPTNEIEDARVDAHTSKFRGMHREWSAKIRDCREVGILSLKLNVMNGMDWGSEAAYIDLGTDTLALFRNWGMSFNDICAIEEALSHVDADTRYLALATERRLDRGVSHFSLFAIDHLTGDQALVFHRSDCAVEGVGCKSHRGLGQLY